MSSDNVPGLPGGDDDNSGDNAPGDPLAEMLKALFGPAAADLEVPAELRGMLENIPGLSLDPAALQSMLGQVQRLMSSSDEGPVNWTTALHVARQVAAAGGDPTVGQAQTRAVSEALRTADVWLSRTVELPSVTARSHALSRAEWIEDTLDTWKVVFEPIATSISDALSQAMAAQAPEEMRGALTEALPMLRSMGSTIVGLQFGQALGALSREVVSGGDTGLPLIDGAVTVLLPTNIDEFSQGLEIPQDEVRLYLALREAAFSRLVSSVPWLRAHLLDTVTEFARGITIDTDRIESTLREIDPTDAEAMQKALSSGLFLPQRTPAQQAALERLENALALSEGWVDQVVDAAAATTLPHAAALRETVRRRRATGGPAEHTFASLVGLELRPRRLREAAAVWAALTQEVGIEARDALWRHPDLLPDAEAFEDPLTFARSIAQGTEQGDAMDVALAELLDEAAGQSEAVERDDTTAEADPRTSDPDPEDEQGGQ